MEKVKAIDDDFTVYSSPDEIFGGMYGDKDRYIAALYTTEKHLQIGLDFHKRQDVDYEMSFIARTVADKVFGSNFDLFLGGVFGTGQARTSSDLAIVSTFFSPFLGQYVEIPDKCKYFKYGLELGASYPLFDKVEAFALFSYINRQYDFEVDAENIPGMGGNPKAAETSLEGWKVESLSVYLGVRYTF